MRYLRICSGGAMTNFSSTVFLLLHHQAVHNRHPPRQLHPEDDRYCISKVKYTDTPKEKRRNREKLGKNNGAQQVVVGMATTVGGNVESSAVPTSVPVRVAHELLQAGHRYLDVRTAEEFSAGHAVGATNVPYMFKVGSGMTKNPKFLEEVLLQFTKDDKIIVGCQSGKRSMMAATSLISAGFTGATDMAGGYAAWTQNGLPIAS
ncbi:thiosulfate sulfurtransferase 16, chloroplastic isoform X2 [Camellia sinensis]|uniref:thiosulfate sulfurtransferase 16, chloroplastic isoform X2 n=1 Tax=Camellia sinensis TaxID=4442 RepID=UPI001035FC0E|nr:thiosulfate sulfurtransferase 16, chloroplastic isoform X2 [Camellia sinensis]